MMNPSSEGVKLKLFFFSILLFLDNAKKKKTRIHCKICFILLVLQNFFIFHGFPPHHHITPPLPTPHPHNEKLIQVQYLCP